MVDLEKDPQLASVFTEQESCLFVDGKRAGDISELEKMADVKSVLPSGFVKETLDEKLQRLITMDKVVLFMKGNPEKPQCGFSQRMIKLLNGYVGTSIAGYGHFDILSDAEVREGLKVFSKWPTYPQLYVGGKLVGGIDICEELHEEGELEDALV